jgi:hypothetical protein
MKNYYVLEVNDESAAEYPHNYNWNDPHSGSALRQYIEKHKDFPSWTPLLEQEIYDDPEFNKLNDFIHGPIEKFCVSKRVKEVLEQFNLPKHKFYPVTVYRSEKKFFGFAKMLKKVNAEYFAFHFDCYYISDTKQFIDFTKTKTTKDYLGLDQTNEIFLNSSFDTSLDLFQIHMSSMTYISEALMLKLKEMKISGIIISNINERKYIVPIPNPKLTWT